MHATVLVWVKKQGISQFRSNDFYDKEKWVLIADESIQFGNKKTLLILSVSERRCNQCKALSVYDIIYTPAVGTSQRSIWINSEGLDAVNLHPNPGQRI